MSKSCVSSMSNRTVLLMRGKAPLFPIILLGAGLLPALAAAESKSATPGGLSAAQIVDKHVAARGGLQAWRAVQTLSVTGKLEAGSGDSAARSAKLAREGVGASGSGAPVLPRAPRTRTRRRRRSKCCCRSGSR